mgnify:CR=1 FL=1
MEQTSLQKEDLAKKYEYQNAQLQLQKDELNSQKDNDESCLRILLLQILTEFG